MVERAWNHPTRESRDEAVREKNEHFSQPRTQARSLYPCYQRRLATEWDSANFPDKLDRWRHIRNCRGRLWTRLHFSLSPPRLSFLAWGYFHARSRFARSKMGTTRSLRGMFISLKSNLSCNLCHFPGEDTQMKMMGIVVLSLASSKRLDCGDDAKESGVRSFLLFSYVRRNLQQGTGFDTVYFIKRNKASLWQGGILYWSFLGLLKRLNRILWYYAFVRNGLSNIILEETCPVMIILELKFLCYFYPLCWLSFTSNEYFLIVCSIKHWKSQCGKMHTRICHFYYENIKLKYPGTVSVEVLRPPNQPYLQPRSQGSLLPALSCSVGRVVTLGTRLPYLLWQCTGRSRYTNYTTWLPRGTILFLIDIRSLVTCCDVSLHS